ncbi:hypothetical protein TSOC_001164 [Tetrabaena socialis]|uniref:phytol kinase n=1 Tax=Tetrabaena socialis TaxID=47790 RepID=A0A2J8AHG6_9CHLO|nr:hypothetical protein TSOC_001164 [Tetrabaena socialis]|eukprot:PNH11958.1 hypothetical protein TSOC_001164 [Tetrabaena socialis]
MSSSQQPAQSRPAQAAAILRSLPGLAERLRSRLPPHRKDLQELWERLSALRLLIQDSTAAPALLSNAAARGALLGVLAVALRQPLPCSAIGAQGGGGGGRGTASAELSWAYHQAAEAACVCCGELMLCNLPRLLAARQVGFALRLLRTQPLQCCARRLAAVGAALLSLERGGEGPQEQPRRGAASSNAARAQLARADCLLLPKDARTAIGQSIFLIQGLIFVAAHPDGEEAELAQLLQELATALRNSCVLEHTARTLLLLLDSRLQHADEKGGDCLNVLGLLCILQRTAERLLSFVIAAPATSEHVALAAALRGVLSGRCVQHAVLVCGLVALCAADGGPSYGLPGELLQRVPLIGQRQGPAGALEGFDLRLVSGRQVLDHRALRRMVRVLGSGDRAAPPGRHGALALLLRVGRLAVASGRSHLTAGRESGAQAAAESAVWHERGSSTSTSAGASGSGSGNWDGSSGSSSNNNSRSSKSSDSHGLRQAQVPALPQRPHPPSMPRLELVLDENALQPLFSGALEAAMALCFPAGPADRPQRAAARVECWRLFADYTRGVLPLRRRDSLPASPVRHLTDPGRLMPGEPLPDSPPPSWEDALAGGWLPCLERLLRRGGEDPAGPELLLSFPALVLMEGAAVIDSPQAWRHLAVLLAYGEPRQAAALVATLGKLLRGADPVRLADVVSKRSVAPALPALWMLASAGLELLTIAAAESDAGGQAQGGLPRGAPSAAGQQLALMLSYALCEWLPPLARSWRGGAVRDGGSAARPGVGRNSSGGNDPYDDGCGGWRQLLLEEAAALGTAGGQASTRRELGEQLAGAAPGLRRSGAAAASQPRFPWRPRLLRALAGSLRAEGHRAMWDCAEALAAVLQSWEAGGSVGTGGEAASSQAEVGAGARVPPAAWRRVEEGSTYVNARVVQRLSATLVPVAEARGVLRTCSHPGCISLAGDSEAEAEAGLVECGRCGAARYCCADCQVAHWRAGHREACVGRG